MKEISIIGYSSDAGGKTSGSDIGPKMFRERGLIKELLSIGLSINDRGDVKPDSGIFPNKNGNLKNYDIVKNCTEKLFNETTKALNNDHFPLIIGGDHSLSIGSYSAVSTHYSKQGERTGLVWIDTHADINTDSTTLSGNIHGMSVAALLDLFPSGLLPNQSKVPALDPESIVYIGLRDLDPEEKIILKKLGIKVYTIKEIDILGIATVVKEIHTLLTKKHCGYTVSFDLDVCDPELVPGTGTPKRGGLTFRETHLMMELFYDYQKMVSLEIVELNPLLDKGFITSDIAVSIAGSALGKSIL